MGNNLKKSLIICLGGVTMLGLTPTVVDAAEFKYDKENIERVSNVTTVPILINLNEGESITKFTLDCDADHTDVTCKIELADKQNFMKADDGSFWFNNLENPLASGSHKVANLILTNNQNSKISSVDVTTKNGTINAETKPALSFSTSVNAKPEEKKESSDATLKSLTVNRGTMVPEFSKDVREYTVYDIKDTINSIKISYECNDGDTCSYSLDGGKSTSGKTVYLNLGENKIALDITSEDGINTETYILNVIRGETTFNSAKLTKLTFDNYELSPAFSKDVTKYALTVPNTVNALTEVIEYETEDDNAKENVEVKGLDNFKVGENKITISVTNVSGDETITYEVVVTRLSEENIEILKYIDGQITFKDSDGIETTLKETEFSKLYPNEYQKITNKEYKFDEEGNKIIEGLQDDDKEQKDKEKKDNKKDNKVWLIVLLIVLGLVVIIVSGILIFRKKKPEETTIEKKEEKQIDVPDQGEETGIEEAIIGEKFSNTLETTIDIDEALSDLMNTKQYEFKDEIEEKLKDKE